MRACYGASRNVQGGLITGLSRYRACVLTTKPKYVNIADINGRHQHHHREQASFRRGSARSRAPDSGEPYFDLIELLFFAYRDFVGDPDEVLAKLGFGRAHHRVLHFVNRNPGMKVAELLDVLKITKQSLGRVLKQLIDEGYVVQKEGANDRRQRLLYVSAGRRGAGDEACRTADRAHRRACSPSSAPARARRRGVSSPA